MKVYIYAHMIMYAMHERIVNVRAEGKRVRVTYNALGVVESRG
jgi:hypothetical protein